MTPRNTADPALNIPDALDSPMRQTLPGHAENLPQEVATALLEAAMALIPKASDSLLRLFRRLRKQAYATQRLRQHN
jgi:hypothetical protein